MEKADEASEAVKDKTEASAEMVKEKTKEAVEVNGTHFKFAKGIGEPCLTFFCICQVTFFNGFCLTQKRLLSTPILKNH